MATKNADPFTAAAQGFASFINRIAIGHPCTVLRRQCQVHQFAIRAHFTPFTLVPAVCHIITKDGIMTLWKGSVGCGVLWAMSQVAEIVIADVFGLPKNVIPEGSQERFWRHVLLKASTYFAMTPFIVSSFVETVRSNTGFSAEDTRVLDVIVRGLDRLRYDFFGAKDSSKRFSIFYLSIPTVGYYTLHFIVAKYTYDTVFGMARRYVSRKMPHERTRFHTIMPEMFATMTSSLIADLLCYPFETILHRLYIQGTRTLIDNLDNGVSAISITAKYQGFFHCLQSLTRKESFSTLYTGIGAIVLQYSLQFCILNILRAAFSHGNSMALHVNTSPRINHHSTSGLLLSGTGSAGTSTTHPSFHHFGTSDADSNPSWGFVGRYPTNNSNGASGNISPIFSRESTNSEGFGQPFYSNLSNSPNVLQPNYSSLLLQAREPIDTLSGQSTSNYLSSSPPFNFDSQ